MRVQLPSGGYATVSPDVTTETLEALDEMLRAAADHLRSKKAKRGSARRGSVVKRNRPAGLRRCTEEK